MPNLRSLLTRGYFPSELPPAFTTSDFANLIVSGNDLPDNLGPGASKSAELEPHSISRLGITRRTAFLPNPIPFLRLCREVVNNFSDLQQHCRQSPISMSVPIDNPEDGRAIVPEHNFRDVLERRSRVRSTSKYVLTSDITKFYSSSYTHSIPWAIHGKGLAKAKRNDLSLLGNLLDLCTRNCQDQQTVGIPIGPDTSMVLSEVILAPLDIALSELIPSLNGFRRVDDYEFGLKTYSEAEVALTGLEEVVRQFELTLNYSKTSIRELPAPLDPEWVFELRTFTFREDPIAFRNDLIHYFSRAYELSEIYAEDFVLNYSIARLTSIPLDQGNWDLVQDFMFQCLMVEPGTFLPVLARLMSARETGLEVDESRLQVVMNHTILQHARAGHPSEVAWALWALIFWNVSVDSDAARSISSLEDSVVALLGMDAETRGLTPSGLDKNVWASFMTEEELFGRQWLLAYEANVKGWLPSLSSNDHVDADPAFGLLKQSGVEFYHSDRLAEYRPSFASGAGFEAAQFSPL